jgi:plastocyanin
MKSSIINKATENSFSVAFLLLLPFVSSTSFAKPQTHVIKIENMMFNPSTIDVHQGDRVVWKNLDIVPHTVTSEVKNQKIESGTIAGQKSFSIKMPDQTIEYFCRFHPTMKATLHLVR